MREQIAKIFPRKAGVALAIGAAVWLAYGGVKHEWANHDASSSDPNRWLRAAEIEPHNAENWYRLGRYRQLDFENANLPLAITYYRRAVEINPRSAYYKLDLASALEMSGNAAEADKFYRAAQENYPISAEVSWRYGNFLLRQQRLPEAYREIHRAVVVDAKLIPLAVSRCWRSNPDVRVLLDQVLPNTPAADWAALAFLVQSKEATAGLAVWDHLLTLKPPIIWRNVFPFLDVLLEQDLFAEAGSVWKQALGAAGLSVENTPAGSLVFNGGFETDVLGGGFGWRQHDLPGSNFDYDTGESHSGTRSARITFDGTQNVYYGDLVQFVLVQPRTRYRFQGFLRTDQISTDSGMRFEIRDTRRSQDLDVLTPNETGTEPWTLEELDFTTGPQTQLIQIMVRRQPSSRLDNKLSGTVWVDDVAVFPTKP
jgi:tetratricopeptide (TPR) repeat protein